MSVGVEQALLPHTGALTVAVTAAPLLAAADSTPRRSPAGLSVQALSTNTVSVFIGGSGVTTSNGYELVSGQAISLPYADPSKVYAVCASSSPEVRFIY